MENIYCRLLRELEFKKAAVLTTKLQKGSIEKVLFQPSVSADFSGWDALITKDNIKEALQTGIPKYYEHDTGAVLLEPYYPEARLIVLGGGHIALPLVEFAAKAGFSVTVIDDREAFANKERFPEAAKVICDSFEKGILNLKISDTDYVVIITRGHRHDTDCLRQLLDKPPKYFGMIGSIKRIQIVKAQLKEEGFDEKTLNRLNAPIGLNIGSETPEEIAVSILAQLIQHKRQKNNTLNNPSRQSRSDMLVLEKLARDEIHPKAVATVIAAKGSVPRETGAKMIVWPNGRIFGSIGGGCSEGAVIHTALQRMQTGGYEKVNVDLTNEAAEEDGMVCGGIMEVLLEVF